MNNIINLEANRSKINFFMKFKKSGTSRDFQERLILFLVIEYREKTN